MVHCRHCRTASKSRETILVSTFNCRCSMCLIVPGLVHAMVEAMRACTNGLRMSLKQLAVVLLTRAHNLTSLVRAIVTPACAHMQTGVVLHSTQQGPAQLSVRNVLV